MKTGAKKHDECCGGAAHGHEAGYRHSEGGGASCCPFCAHFGGRCSNILIGALLAGLFFAAALSFRRSE